MCISRDIQINVRIALFIMTTIKTVKNKTFINRVKLNDL